MLHPPICLQVSLKLRKVALMFLTVGELPHEQLWLEWLQQAEGLLPLRALLDPAAVCLRKCGQGGSAGAARWGAEGGGRGWWCRVCVVVHVP